MVGGGQRQVSDGGRRGGLAHRTLRRRCHRRSRRWSTGCHSLGGRSRRVIGGRIVGRRRSGRRWLFRCARRSCRRGGDEWRDGWAWHRALLELLPHSAVRLVQRSLRRLILGGVAHRPGCCGDVRMRARILHEVDRDLPRLPRLIAVLRLGRLWFVVRRVTARPPPAAAAAAD